MTKEVDVFGASFAGVRSMLPLNLNSSLVHMRRSEKRKKTLRLTRMVEKIPLVYAAVTTPSRMRRRCGWMSVSNSPTIRCCTAISLDMFSMARWPSLITEATRCTAWSASFRAPNSGW